MTPEFSLDDLGDCYPTHSVSSGYGQMSARTSSSLSANGRDIRCRKDCPSIILPPSWSSPPLSPTVSYVIKLRSYKKMCRVAAGRIIASMKNALSGFNGSDTHCKSNNMGKVVPAIEANLPIALVVLNRATPRPTFLGSAHLNPAPEARDKSLWNSGAHKTFALHSNKILINNS